MYLSRMKAYFLVKDMSFGCMMEQKFSKAKVHIQIHGIPIKKVADKKRIIGKKAKGGTKNERKNSTR
jgi:hypothetical protein